MPHLPEMHRLGALTWSSSEEASQVRSALGTKARHMRKVLVVEDHYVIALDLSEALARSGVKVLGPVTTLDAAS